MEKSKLSDRTKYPLLSQIVKSISNPEFWITDENLNDFTPPMTCKEYINDMYASEINNKPINCYGFKWEGKKGILEMPNWGVSLTNGDLRPFTDEEINNIQKGLSLLSNKKDKLELIVPNDKIAVYVKVSNYYYNPIILQTLVTILRNSQYSDISENFENISKTSNPNDKSRLTLLVRNKSSLDNFINLISQIKKRTESISELKTYMNNYNNLNVHGLGLFNYLEQLKKTKELEKV